MPHVLPGNSESDKTKDVTTLDWNVDGSLLATGSYDGYARIWNSAGGSTSLLATPCTLPAHVVTYLAAVSCKQPKDYMEACLYNYSMQAACTYGGLSVCFSMQAASTQNGSSCCHHVKAACTDCAGPEA